MSFSIVATTRQKLALPNYLHLLFFRIRRDHYVVCLDFVFRPFGIHYFAPVKLHWDSGDIPKRAGSKVHCEGSSFVVAILLAVATKVAARLIIVVVAKVAVGIIVAYGLVAWLTVNSSPR